MPPTRRSRPSAGPIAKGGQKSLSFAHSKVTKPASSVKSSQEKEKDQSISITASTPSSTPLAPASTSTSIDVGHVTSTASIAQQAAAESAREEPTPEEREARAVSDEQVRRYWKDREAERRTRRVHQEGVSVEERVLRLFDMSSQYGVSFYFLFFNAILCYYWTTKLTQINPFQPAIGIARRKRWVRAHKLGLAPPIEVLAVLLKEEGKKNTRIERAYVDELMSSNAVLADA